MTYPQSSPNIHYSLVLGRFQPLHLGHIEYLEAARKRATKLVIGVTNPDINRLTEDETDPKRSRTESNPFPYFDRYEMIAASLVEAGWNCHDFAIIPAEINNSAEMVPFLPAQASTIVCITTYDGWGDRKADIMTALGYRVEILWRRNADDRLTSGTDIRLAMRTGGEWRDFVPAAVARYLDDSGWASKFFEQPPAASPPRAPARGQ